MDRSRFGVLLLVLSVVVLLAFSSSASANSSPVVTNVSAQQISGTGQVRITYDVADADGDSLSANVVCSSNNGISFDLYPVTVSGAIRTPMLPGTGKEIIWNAAADYPGRYWSQVVAKVVVSDGPSIGGPMVLVQAGAFTMGDGNFSPIHVVTLDPYYIDKFEVTNGEFEAFVSAGGYTTQALWSEAGWTWRVANGVTEPLYWSTGQNHSGPSWPGFPVVGVSWYEAEAYARFAAKRLPTEAEWEKAARSTDERMYPFGNVADASRLNYYQSGDPYSEGSTPVGFYDGRRHPSPEFQTTDSPGPYGTYDQAGNVIEWVHDWYAPNYYAVSPPTNPPGPAQTGARVIRDNPWSTPGAYLYQFKSTYRDQSDPTVRSELYGFRCARTP